jgi:hypothetical protein
MKRVIKCLANSSFLVSKLNNGSKVFSAALRKILQFELKTKVSLAAKKTTFERG